jgi:hypothetical protein
MKKFMLISIAMFALLFSEEFVINETPFSVEVINSTTQQTTIEYNLGGFYRESIDIQGETYFRLQLEKESRTYQAGNPELPKITRSIIIPNDAKVEVKIVEKEYVDINMKIAPSKGKILRTINPDDVEHVFSDTYDKDNFFPENNSSLDSPYILRDYRGIAVTAYPFTYNPQTEVLRVYTHLVLEVNTVGTDDVNIKTTRSNTQHKAFLGLYANHFINFELTRYETIEEQGRMIVISYGPFMDEIQPFVDWKNQKGIKCDLYNVSDFGSNANTIKAFIQAEYDSDSELTFVQLVGDAAQVPTLYVGGDSDPAFGFLEGNDVYPELFVGRFSAENSGHVITQVERTIHYERDIFDGDWLAKGIGIGSSEGTGQGDEGEADWEHQDNIREKLMTFGYTDVDQVYDVNGGDIADIFNGLMAGRGIVNYTGHGSETSWATTGFSNTQVNQLENDYLLPFINSVACVNGAFVSTTCFAEAWLRATNNTTGVPTGAIAMYAATINQSWAPPMRGQDHAIDLIVGYDYYENTEIDQKNSIGGIWVNGACDMIDEYGDDDMMSTWTIFGDASLQIRTEAPSAMNLSHTGTIFIGANTYVVSTGVSGALVALSEDGILLGSAYADETGNATIEMDEAVDNPTVLDLTVTAFNATTAFEEVSVIAPEGAYIVISDYSIVGGGTNVYYGENPMVSITLENVGVDAATNVTGTFESFDELVITSDTFIEFGNIPAGGTSTVEGGFGMLISESIPNGYNFTVTANLESTTNEWQSIMSFTAYAPDLALGSINIENDDNNNGMLDPGETVDIEVEITNNGGATANNVLAQLSGNDNFITINNSDVTFNQIENSSTEIAVFSITISEEVDLGEVAEFTVQVSADGGYDDSSSFELTVGINVEDFESGGLYAYPWETDWTITSESYEGSYATKSTNIDHNTVSSLSVTLSVTSSDVITFFRRVSSEGNYDYLRFYIDEELQEEWAGDIPWSEVSYSVAYGMRTFKWEYSKDGSVSTGEDCAWVDYITFPPIGPPPPPPILSVTPPIFDVSVPIGDELTEMLLISNTGGGTLEYTLNLEETTTREDIEIIERDEYVTDIAVDIAKKQEVADMGIVDEDVPVYVDEAYLPNTRSLDVNINVDGGSWQGEVTWEIVNTVGTTVVSGGCPFNDDVSLDGGMYTLYAHDSYGDGWNGNYMVVTGTDGVEYFNYTMDSGSEGTATFEIEEPISWLLLDSNSGSVNEGQTDDIGLNFNTVGLTEGNIYTANLTVNAGVGFEIIPITLTVGEPGPQPMISFNVSEINEVVLEDQVFTSSFEISNIGEEESTLNYYINIVGTPWVTLSSDIGQCEYGETVIIDVELDATDILEGTYTAEIVILHNGPSNQFIMPVIMNVIAVDYDFLVNLEISNDLGATQNMTFGTHQFATNGYDTGFDLYCPPPPPEPSFASWLKNIHDNDSYLADIRPTTLIVGNSEWQVQIQGGESSSYLIEWNLDDLDYGAYILTDVLTDGQIVSVDMHSQNSITIENPALNLFSIKHTYGINVEFSNFVGWNMIGMPVGIEHEDYLNVFPNTLSNTLYGFTSSGYYSSSNLQVGNGYWLRFVDESNDVLTGLPINIVELTLAENWNLISGISSDLMVSSIVDLDGVIIPNTIYSFTENGYENSDVIEPGKAYWIRANSDGIIELNASLNIARRSTFTDQLSGSNELSFNSNSLYFGVSLSETESLSYSLPPKPPVGSFDVRYSDDMKYTGETGSIELMNTSDYVTLSYTVNNNEKWTLISLEGDSYTLSGTDEIEILSSDSYTLLKENDIPLSYSLKQNYPNPFNPTTVLGYEIMEDGNVNLSIYNINGQLVETLINTNVTAGYHEITWNASNAASGIYIVKLTAGSFTSTNKMLLVK